MVLYGGAGLQPPEAALTRVLSCLGATILGSTSASIPSGPLPPNCLVLSHATCTPDKAIKRWVLQDQPVGSYLV